MESDADLFEDVFQNRRVDQGIAFVMTEAEVMSAGSEDYYLAALTLSDLAAQVLLEDAKHRAQSECLQSALGCICQVNCLVRDLLGGFVRRCQW